MDRFSELRAFTAVIAAGGFSAAARQTGQSRSAVNRLVIALEARLGVQLLHRTTRSISPTSSGRALYDRARQLLDDLDEIEAAVISTRTEAVGKLRISAPLSFGELDFSEMVVAFLARHPRLEIDVSFESRLVDPVAEGLDLVVRIAQPDEETPLVDHRILRLDYALCAAPEYLSRFAPVSSPSALADHAALHLRQAASSPEWTLNGPEGPVTVAARPVMTANSLEPLLTAARAGLGLAVIPEYAIRADLASGRLVRVLPDYELAPRMLQVIYPPARHLSAKVRLFTEFVEAHCGPSTPEAEPTLGKDRD